MRRPWRASGLIVVLLAAVGCLGRGAGHSSPTWLDRLGGQTVAPHGLFVFTTLLDLPAGDPFLNRDLWAAAPAPMNHEQVVLLAQNGLRVGVVTGSLAPTGFDELLASEGTSLAPTFRTMRPGVAKVIPVNGPIEQCSIRVLPGLTEDPTRFELSDVECGLSVTAEQADGELVRLRCSWQMQHGDRQAFLKPSADGTTFARRDHKPLEVFPTLDWDVTLGPTDSLVVGSTAEPTDTLGQTFFFASTAGRIRQRVLVIRAGHGSGGTDGPARTVGAAAARLNVE